MRGEYTNVTQHCAGVPILKLNSEGEGVEVEASGIVIRLMRTDEGVVCDMYSGDILEYADDDDAHMASCYAFFSEAEEDER